MPTANLDIRFAVGIQLDDAGDFGINPTDTFSTFAAGSICTGVPSSSKGAMNSGSRQVLIYRRRSNF